MLDATQKYAEPLTAERLFGWHAALFPTGRSNMHRIAVGAWRSDRTGPMVVVSGPIGRERVHYQAPAAPRLGGEVQAFLGWFNGEEGIDPVVKAAVAHLWFVTIHPFDDGNGRIAADGLLRTVLEKAAFWTRHGSEAFNPRQQDMLNRLLDGFTGKLTSSKWARIEKCSPDTALRDITDLLDRRILRRDAGGGRSTSYSLIPKAASSRTQ